MAERWMSFRRRLRATKVTATCNRAIYGFENSDDEVFTSRVINVEFHHRHVSVNISCKSVSLLQHESTANRVGSQNKTCSSKLAPYKVPNYLSTYAGYITSRLVDEILQIYYLFPFILTEELLSTPENSERGLLWLL